MVNRIQDIPQMKRLLPTVCTECKTPHCARGVHKHQARLQQKPHINACLRQPFIISRYTSEKHWCKRCYQFCHTFSFSKSIPLSKQNWACFWLLSCEFSIHRVRGKKIILLLWWRRLARFDKLKSLQGAYWPWSSFISHSLSERDRKTLPHFSCEWVN